MRFEEFNDFTHPINICHMAYVGSSGSGKSQGWCLNELRRYICSADAETAPSLIVLDPKGELYRELGLLAKQQDYDNYVVYDLRHPSLSPHSWSPIWEAYTRFKAGNVDGASETVRRFSAALAPLDSSEAPFWPLSAQSLCSALVFSLFVLAPSDDYINMSSLMDIVSSLEERSGILTMGQIIADMLPKESIAHRYMKSFMQGPADTRKSVHFTLNQHVQDLCQTEAMLAFLNRPCTPFSDIDFNERSIIWVLLPESTCYSAVAGTLIDTLAKHLLDLADRQPNQQLKRRTYFFLEEAGSLRIGSLPVLAAGGRSRNIRIRLAIQDPFSQLNSLYGENQGEAIRSNISTWAVYPTNSYYALEIFSKLCGYAEDEEKRIRPLLSPAELFSLPKEHCLFVHGGERAVIKVPFYYRKYGTNKVAPIFVRMEVDRAPIKVLTSQVIQKIRAEKAKRIINEPRANIFKGNDTPVVPTLEENEGLLDAIADVEKKLKDIREEEEKHKIALSNAEGPNSANKLFYLVITKINGKAETADALSTSTGMNHLFLDKVLESVPVKLPFPSQVEAFKAYFKLQGKCAEAYVTSEEVTASS